MHKIKRHSDMVSGYGGFLLYFALSLLTIIGLSLISTVILGTLDDPTRCIGIFSLGTLLISAVVCGVICGRRFEGLKHPLLISLSVVLIMLLCGVIISGGKLTWGAFMNYGCYIGAYVLSAFLGKKRARHRHR